jgi:hypothetical protein
MIDIRTIYGCLASGAFHAAVLGALALGTLAPPWEAEPPMLVVSQRVSDDLVETVEFEVPVPPRATWEFPIVAPPTAEPIAATAGELDRLLGEDLPGPPDSAARGFGLPGGVLPGAGGGGVPQEGAATFFGTTVAGTRFVYVVDASRSMVGGRFRKATRELSRSVCNLRPDQQYYVIFFGLDCYPMYFPQPCPSLVPSMPETWRRLHQWMRNVDPRTQGATNGRSAMLLALALEPDAVYLLSDGAFTDDTVVSLLALEPNSIPIHTIAFGSEDARWDLQRIAHRHGGTYRFVR